MAVVRNIIPSQEQVWTWLCTLITTWRIAMSIKTAWITNIPASTDTGTVRRALGRTGICCSIFFQFTKWIQTPFKHEKQFGRMENRWSNQTIVGQVQSAQMGQFLQRWQCFQPTTRHLNHTAMAKKFVTNTDEVVFKKKMLPPAETLAPEKTTIAGNSKVIIQGKEQAPEKKGVEEAQEKEEEDI